MGFFDQIGNTLSLLTNTETGTKKSNNAQLGLLNTSLSADVPINVDARTSSYAPVNTDSRQYVYTDQRQISLIYDSPNATLTSKKADSASATNRPAVTSSPSTSGADVPIQVPVNFGLPSFSGVGSWLLLGGAVVGGYFLIKTASGGKK